MKRAFSPIYLAILSGIILIILIINGMLEMNRTKKGFYSLLEREALILLQHYEKNIEETLLSLRAMETSQGHANPSLSGFFFGLEESLAEYLLGVLHRVDQIDSDKPLTSSDFQSLLAQYLITSIEVYDSKGRLLRSSPHPSRSTNRELMLRELIEKKRPLFMDLFGRSISESDSFSIAIWRRMAPGIIALHIGRDDMKELIHRFALQRAISDIALGEDILFVTVLDADLRTMAHSDPGPSHQEQDHPFLRTVLKSQAPLTRTYRSPGGEEVFEVAKPFSVRGELAGVILIAYSPKGIYPVLSQTKKSVALSILFFLILGLSAVAWVWINQNRHLRKVREMEDRVRLAERLSSLGHLAAGVAHEIRNPLNAIGMGLQRLKREFLPGDESKRGDYLSFVELLLREIRRMNEIIEQFLGLSRPFHLNKKISSLQELLTNLVNLFKEEASSVGILMEIRLDPDTPPIEMDTEKLTQALINIMKNGIEAMKDGGTLRIETHSFKDRVEIAIIDSGPGIPPEEVEKIFNYYYSTKEGGVGLGLPIAHRIIEAHQGELKVESKVGVGTKVTVTLPT